jgi:hypothetical protein
MRKWFRLYLIIFSIFGIFGAVTSLNDPLALAVIVASVLIESCVACAAAWSLTKIKKKPTIEGQEAILGLFAAFFVAILSHFLILL